MSILNSLIESLTKFLDKFIVNKDYLHNYIIPKEV